MGNHLFEKSLNLLGSWDASEIISRNNTSKKLLLMEKKNETFLFEGSLIFLVVVFLNGEAYLFSVNGNHPKKS